MSFVARLRNESFYLAFRQFPPFRKLTGIKLKSADDIYSYLKSGIPSGNIGILLSRGRDSLILASCLPKGSMAYTVKAIETFRDESIEAAQFAKRLDLVHKVITITWADYKFYNDQLIKFKKQPLELSEPWAYKVALQAKEDGVDFLVSGVGTLSSCGECAFLHDLKNDVPRFLRKCAFLNPEDILINPCTLAELCEEYIKDNQIDSVRLMDGISYAEVGFNNAIACAGLKHIAPYSMMEFDLDIERAKREGKYILAEIFYKVFGQDAPPKEIPSIPHTKWLEHYKPSHSNFKKDLKVHKGSNKWLLYQLESYWRLNDNCHWV